MRHLFQDWAAFESAAGAARQVLVLSDYDGTLTPIVGRPQDAVMPPGVRDKLQRLAGKPSFSVGVISGRLLSELKGMVGLEGIYYAGNHGLEIEGPGLSFIHEAARQARPQMKKLASEFNDRLAGIPGVVIEDKGLSLSVHCRLVEENGQAGVLEIFREITAPAVAEGLVRVSYGKKVGEVRPPVDWHKGKAVETIKEEIEKARGVSDSLTVYLGDDVTDEDAFKVMRPPAGWSVYVGGENTTSAADYFLDSTDEVAGFLERLLKL